MGILSSDFKCIPFLSSLIYGNSAFIHTRLQTGQITKWPANAAVSEILESIGLISYKQAGSVPFQGIQNEKHFENKLHSLKECGERYLNESKILML